MCEPVQSVGEEPIPHTITSNDELPSYRVVFKVDFILDFVSYLEFGPCPDTVYPVLNGKVVREASEIRQLKCLSCNCSSMTNSN